MNVAAFHFENWDKPDCADRSALVIEPGLWRMRNGHTAKIQKQLDIPYKDGMTGKQKVWKIWKGECIECETPMTWTINGTYAALGRHRNDIISRVE